MSFMFNPYPYDDPKAVNSIQFNAGLINTITGDTAASIKKLTNLIVEQAASGASIIGLDGYLSAPMEQFVNLLTLQLVQNGINPQILTTKSLLLDNDTLYEKLLPYLPEDRVTDPVLLYGSLYKEGYESLMEEAEIKALSAKIREFASRDSGVLIVYGYGALIKALRTDYTVKLSIDMTQKRTILNIRSGKLTNLGSTLHLPVNQIIRRSYYVDFEVAMELRGELVRGGEIDYYITGDCPDRMQMLPISTLKELFGTMVSYPLRARPVYIEGVWGGFYVQRLRNLPKEMKNCAWVFDLIPMEVSIVADLNAMQLEFPFYFFVQIIGEKLMGEQAYKKFRGYFPIRFNYDDTYHSSGNMSIQVHPNGEYLRQNNNEFCRQDESYYMVVTGQEAKTYCGFRDGADAEEFVEKTRRAEQFGEGFNHDDYVYAHPSVAGQQFLIPAGTIHASGRNQVILEIGSLTMGSYTYKMYDYMRKDLEGNLRPIHTYHGDKVLKREFRESWVKENLIQTPRVLREGDGYQEMLIGQHDLLYFSLRHVLFWDKYEDETTDRFHVLVLVEGEKCLIRSLTNPDRFFEQSYLDMVIVPAGFGPYEVVNQGVEKVTIHKTLLKDGYENVVL